LWKGNKIDLEGLVMEKVVHEIALEEIRVILKQKEFKGLKVVENNSKTGVSFFQGKNRLCKVLKTKRGLSIEINVSLPETLKKLDGMQTIPADVAHKKHLGTMKHMFHGIDASKVKLIMSEAIKEFQKMMSQEIKEA
jgi:hypothetical protein